MHTYHILNGDALAERFPEEIMGQTLVCRECLIDGPLRGRNLEKFFTNRANYLSDSYGEDEYEFYLGAVLPEFEDMQQIPEGSNVYFWFEADLFCQYNFWFCVSLMDMAAGNRYYLVLPEAPHQYGFSGLKNSELVAAHHQALPLTTMTLAVIQQLWKACKQGDHKTALASTEMLSLSIDGLVDLNKTLQDFYHEEHLKLLKQIMEAQGESGFGPVFQDFCRLAPQYGFGDLQLYQMYRKLS